MPMYTKTYCVYEQTWPLCRYLLAAGFWGGNRMRQAEVCRIGRRLQWKMNNCITSEIERGSNGLRTNQSTLIFISRRWRCRYSCPEESTDCHLLKKQSECLQYKNNPLDVSTEQDISVSDVSWDDIKLILMHFFIFMLSQYHHNFNLLYL